MSKNANINFESDLLNQFSFCASQLIRLNFKAKNLTELKRKIESAILELNSKFNYAEKVAFYNFEFFEKNSFVHKVIPESFKQAGRKYNISCELILYSNDLKEINFALHLALFAIRNKSEFAGYETNCQLSNTF